MIEINNLDFGYRGDKKQVFDGLNLTFEENKIYGLLGKNGMGKSTLLYLIAGLLRPKKGSVSFNGIATQERRVETLQDIFIVPEEFEIPHTSLKGFIKMHKDFYPNFNEEVLVQCLKDFELEETPDLKKLSMGQKKKVYMSFALASGTRVLLMDEPTNGLDIPSKSLFRKVIMQNMQDDTTLIISTHQVHDIESLLDHIVILDNSKIIMNESVADITEKYSFTFRQPGDNDGVLYAEPALQGNATIALKSEDEEETALNLELLFNAATKGKL